jgi:lipoprotein-anchoring transpeptidase ErfK/SrfK
MTTLFTLALLAITAQTPPAQTLPVQSASPRLIEGLALQVTLDRAGFSTGVLDGQLGTNTKRAAEAYRKQNGSDPAPAEEPLVTYQITSADVAGPFAGQIPRDLMAQSKLPALSYTSVIELLAERFHTTPKMLQALNPAATFAADEQIRVPHVEPLVLPAAQPTGTTARPVGTSGQTPTAAVVVTVSRSNSSLTVTSVDGKVVMFAPVTTGSDHDRLPIGEWKVNGVQYNPTFRYNPDLFWDADPSHTKAMIPPGPNGPVGLVWIDISKEHYGLHGTPEPSQIGKTQSHGCVRLTNWDAIKLAGLVQPGTKVVFTE